MITQPTGSRADAQPMVDKAQPMVWNGGAPISQSARPHARATVMATGGQPAQATPAARIDVVQQLPWLLLTRPDNVVALALAYESAQSQGTRTKEAVASRRKRLCDLGIAAGALLVLFPIMITVSLFVKLIDRGRVFLVHPRIGLRGRPFPCYKFRTMVSDAEEQLKKILASDPLLAAQWHTDRKLRYDPRVTSVGHLLRKTSLDEVPQLLNVLRGEMSCVGPRPVTAEELRRYGEVACDYAKVRPGLTGLWQVCGRSHRSYTERIALDRLYVQAWSLRLDLAILLRTIPTVLRVDQTT